jgi:glutamyl-tRNA reductase
LSVVVVGLEHRRSPLPVIERVALRDTEVPKVLGALRDRSNFEETVVLSTCLRTEVYAVVDRFHDAVAEVLDVLADRSRLGVEALEPHLSVRFDDDVARHLFAVASGLESAVPGETEVLGQVRRAWERAQGERASGPVLAELFRHAVHTGKRVRAETGISRGTTSFSHGAVQLAERRLEGGFADRRVLVAGAGELGRGVLDALLGRPAGRRPLAVAVASRTRASADELVVGAVPAGLPGPVELASYTLGEAGRAVAEADVLFATLATEATVFSNELLEGRNGRALLIVDLGVPRNVDPKLKVATGVTLIDLDDLSASVASALDERHAEAVQARAILDEELDRYRAAGRERGAAPVIATLRAKLETLRATELDRHRGQLAARSDEEWAQIDATTRAVLAKVLHQPTMVLKETAGTPRGERLVEALRTLFDL